MRKNKPVKGGLWGRSCPRVAPFLSTLTGQKLHTPLTFIDVLCDILFL